MIQGQTTKLLQIEILMEALMLDKPLQILLVALEQ
jgi:hypothetical protein